MNAESINNPEAFSLSFEETNRNHFFFFSTIEVSRYSLHALGLLIVRGTVPNFSLQNQKRLERTTFFDFSSETDVFHGTFNRIPFINFLYVSLDGLLGTRFVEHTVSRFRVSFPFVFFFFFSNSSSNEFNPVQLKYLL